MDKIKIRRLIVNKSLTYFLNTLSKINSDCLENLDKENYQFQVANSLICTFEQIKTNVDLTEKLFFTNYDFDPNKYSSLKHFDDKEDKLTTNQILFCSDSDLNLSISSLNSSKNLLINDETIESNSFSLNNTLNSSNLDFNKCEFDSTKDGSNQKSVDSGFSTLISNNNLSNENLSIIKVPNSNFQKNQQEFLSSLLMFLHNINDANNFLSENNFADFVYNLPETIALNLVKVFSKKEASFKIDPSELEWLVSEDEVPQKLLPLPSNVQILSQHLKELDLVSETSENSLLIDKELLKNIKENFSKKIDSKFNEEPTIKERKLSNDPLISSPEKFLILERCSSLSFSNDQTDESRRLNDFLDSKKYLGFSLNNIKYRGNNEWAPPRSQIIFHIHPPLKKNQLIMKQNFRCCNCGLKIDKNYMHRLLYCHYTGKYFCQHGCHSKKNTIIPAYIINKWDFNFYPVSNYAFQVIEKNFTEPLFNIQDLNPKLYKKIRQFEMLSQFRNQVLKTKDYIYRCKKAGNLLVAYLMFEPKHFIESTNDLKYSLEDLIDIKNKSKIVKRVFMLVSDSINHIVNCSFCKAKGFICELCSNSQDKSNQTDNLKVDLIFPFQTDNVKQCENCFACYHISCLTANQFKCVKCIRIQKRKNFNEFER